jgi:hypothetical protein
VVGEVLGVLDERRVASRAARDAANAVDAIVRGVRPNWLPELGIRAAATDRFHEAPRRAGDGVRTGARAAGRAARVAARLMQIVTGSSASTRTRRTSNYRCRTVVMVGRGSVRMSGSTDASGCRHHRAALEFPHYAQILIVHTSVHAVVSRHVTEHTWALSPPWTVSSASLDSARMVSVDRRNLRVEIFFIVVLLSPLRVCEARTRAIDSLGSLVRRDQIPHLRWMSNGTRFAHERLS